MSQTPLLRFLWADGVIRHAATVAAERETTLVSWSVHRLASGDCCLVRRTAISSGIRWRSFVVSFDAVTAVAFTERGRRNLLAGEPCGDPEAACLFENWKRLNSLPPTLDLITRDVWRAIRDVRRPPSS